MSSEEYDLNRKSKWFAVTLTLTVVAGIFMALSIQGDDSIFQFFYGVFIGGAFLTALTAFRYIHAINIR